MQNNTIVGYANLSCVQSLVIGNDLYIHLMTDRGRCVEATEPPSWHANTVVKNIWDLLMSTFIFATFRIL